VALEGLDRLVDAQLADVDALISAAGCEARVGLPVDVQCRGRVEGELLGALSRRCVPDYSRLRSQIHTVSVLLYLAYR
jgi:hypothetical protein